MIQNFFFEKKINMDYDDEGGYDPRDFVYSESSDSGSDDEIINRKIKTSKYRKYQAPEFTTEYYNSEEDNSMDSFCHKLRQLDVDTSQYTLSFSKLLSTSMPNIHTDSFNSVESDERSKTLQNRSRIACIRLPDSFSTPVKCKDLNSYSQPLPAPTSVDSNTQCSIDPLQFGCNHPECNKTLQRNHTSSNSNIDLEQSTNTHVHQLRHLRSTLSKPLFDPISKLPSKTLSLNSKSLKNHQNKNTLPTRSNPKRTSTITLPSYENIQKVKKLIICKKTNCGKFFATESELEVHEQTVHPYKCHHCNIRFEKWHYIEKHMDTHALKFPRKCEVPGCSKVLAMSYSYQAHLLNHQRKLEKN
ncbi:hypothetical protein C2G38_437487 [Gigaspora rosea]|uniref:C2H2-type domain-containing protein n=1 Tax=Gigaspora rosea TaxID=44941 RepID=A0A397VXA9_9GLOM|nr:hypothetical protein C2G38_437487 [Gigaspora rosea]